MMTCLRCGGKGTIVENEQRIMCRRCKGKTVVDGEMERHQIFGRAATMRRRVVLTSGVVARLIFWGPTESDRVLVRINNKENTSATNVELKKSDIKEMFT